MSDLEQQMEVHLKRLPKRVKVGGYRYRIDLAPASDPELEGDDGSTNFSDLRIALNQERPFQNVVNTLWHEVNHTINYVYGVTDNSCEEDFAAQNANGWMAVRIDNPKFDTWMSRAIRLLRMTK